MLRNIDFASALAFVGSLSHDTSVSCSWSVLRGAVAGLTARRGRLDRTQLSGANCGCGCRDRPAQLTRRGVHDRDS